MAFLAALGGAGAGAGAASSVLPAVAGTAASLAGSGGSSAAKQGPSWWSQYGQGMVEQGMDSQRGNQARLQQQQDELMQQMMANSGMWGSMIR